MRGERADGAHDGAAAREPAPPARQVAAPASLGALAGLAPVLTPSVVLDLQRTAGNTRVGRMLQRQRHEPHIRGRRMGLGIAYSLGRSWHVHWALIHARVAAMPDLAPFMAAFSVADLERGSASRRVRLANGTEVQVDLASQRGSAREGSTRVVGPGHVSIVFNRGADLDVAVGVGPGGQITQEAVTRANADPAALQRNLDQQVFEVLVHELSHALLLLERGTAGPHSAVSAEGDALAAAASTGPAAAAATHVDLELRVLIQATVDANVPPAGRAQVTATLASDPDLAPARVRQWILDERTARSVSDRAVSSSTANQRIVDSYVGSLRQLIRAKVARAARIRAAIDPGGDGLSRAVLTWLGATTAAAAAARPSQAAGPAPGQPRPVVPPGGPGGQRPAAEGGQR